MKTAKTFHVVKVHHHDKAPTSHVGRFSSSAEAILTHRKKFPRASSITAQGYEPKGK